MSIETIYMKNWYKISQTVETEESEILEETWELICDWYWDEIQGFVLNSLKKEYVQKLIESGSLDYKAQGFDINSLRPPKEPIEEDKDWFEIDVHDMAQFRDYLNSLSPQFVQKLESGAKAMKEDTSVTWDFNLKNFSKQKPRRQRKKS